MKAFEFVVLFLLMIGTAALGPSNNRNTLDLAADKITISSRDGMLLTLKSRKLQIASPSAEYVDEGHVDLEDYRPIDPVPSSKAKVRPGPIMHQAPLLPFIPKQPSPPPSPPPARPRRGTGTGGIP